MPNMVNQGNWDICEENYNAMYGFAFSRVDEKTLTELLSGWRAMESLNDQYVLFYLNNPSKMASFSFEDKRFFFQNCILYAPFESIAEFLEAVPELVNAKYGSAKEPLVDYCYGLLEDLKSTQVSESPTLVSQTRKYQKIVDYLTQEKGLRISDTTIAQQELENLNPRESVENKAVLISVQNSIEKLLDKYGYLKPGAISPLGTSSHPSAALQAFKSWLQQPRPKTPTLKDAMASFKAAMNAKVDAKKYSKRNREELYGMYRYTVSNSSPTKTFTMPEIFVVFWQAFNDAREIPLKDRTDFLNRWIEAMYEAGHSQDAEHNTVIDFEGTTAGCSNAMINMSVGVLASQHSCVKVNYANTTTMERKAFYDFFTTWVLEAWPAQKDKLQPLLEQWIKDPLNGMPDALYEMPGLKETLKKQLRAEYKDVVAAVDLEREIAIVMELLQLRGGDQLSNRLKQQLLQERVDTFVKSEHVSEAALKDARLESERPKTSVAKVWGLKSTAWKTFFENTLKKLLPKNPSPEVRHSYETIELDVVKAYLHAPAKSETITQGVTHSRIPTGKRLPPVNVSKK